ncbi:hypothetical protein PoB_006645600 [Plakobranchus ocellatus]|uniref:Uncharacterized protein n=1 Tax=Plakobranchus ocellatus TaxID=259542 RepID=A0AAV4D7D3_9GAST|nr:hypothetical protein PoB_006645600 [Plakobranchus ocellatus]
MSRQSSDTKGKNKFNRHSTINLQKHYNCIQSSQITSTNTDFTDNTTPVINSAPPDDELDHIIQDTSVFTSQTSLDTANEQTNHQQITRETKSFSANPQHKLKHKEENKQTNKQTSINDERNQVNDSQSTTQTTPQRRKPILV